MEEINKIVMKIESTSKAVTLYGLLQRIKTSKLYANGRVTTFTEFKREAVLMY